ncbi:MAG: DUF5615 family PIN-like protein [Roseofilum sp. SBFL]|uniref:DUF5615 family PIN-like protein n=1 Tax=unclassified Roseofilum TaxID=2620099 RepID=UPI001B0ABAEA|nr:MULTISPECIES: DUF5615 family PIN-like protein [unclassified Roseofilum]MBP0012683.1 DUF5615 family PIN-like protein [Roseofilum sp. SID3]MBP0026350.1 DUF5615 family PIN-like protein [Roseofilum sp. SID2]MBP0039993.1 DUF5615 family PIN-like protein [Roseofilum sp. SID1]MBP0042338.1 DUF5615 family PIN-like protein [Roseofilum sp. SBFL]
MAIRLYMDVHVPQSITDLLRRRGIDVLTAFEDGTQELPDDRLLVRVTELKRVLFTQDIRFRVLAESWQAEGKHFSGLIFGHQLGGTIGQFVQDLELIAQASEPDEWINGVEYIPFK